MPLDSKAKRSAVVVGALAIAVLGMAIFVLSRSQGNETPLLGTTGPSAVEAAAPSPPLTPPTPPTPAPVADAASTLSDDGVTPLLEARRAAAEANPPATSAASTTFAPSTAQGGFDGASNFPITKLSDTHFAVDFPGTAYMFYFRLTSVRGKAIRIDLNNVNEGKWRTLNPVYRDVNADTKILLQRSTADADIAGTKTFPSLNGPQLPDTTGLPWHYIPNVWSSSTSGPTKVVSFVHKFDSDDVYVAMKTPFDLTDYANVVDDTKTQPGVQVIELGMTPAKNPVRIIKISSGDATEKTNPTLLIWGREFPNENDTSWVVTGAMQRLLRPDAATQELRKHFTYFFIPVLDPDAAADCNHEGSDYSYGGMGSPLSILYGKFVREWVQGGGRFDLVCSLHNSESRERPQINFPFMVEPGPWRASLESVLRSIAESATSAGFLVNEKPWWTQEAGSTVNRNAALTPTRFGNWMKATFGMQYLMLYANSQDPTRHLNAPEVKSLGGQVILGATQYFSTPEAAEFTTHVNDSRDAYVDRWKQFGAEITTTNPFQAEQQCLEKKMQTLAPKAQ